MARIGIYGGTFNPPHKGHMMAAQQAICRLALDRLLLIPNKIAPHKDLPTDSASPRRRTDMLRLAAKDLPKAEISELELERDGVSYTYETILTLKQQYPSEELILLMGTDMFLCFDRWKNPQIIWENATLGVFYRGDREEVSLIDEKKRELEALGAKVILVDNPVHRMSSTDLRRMLTFGCGRAMLSEDVYAYILENRLYGTAESYRNLSEEELERKVSALLEPGRIAHVLGCRETAVALAKHWGASETDAARAALLHDVTKALPEDLQLTLCREYGRILKAFSVQNPKTLHALTGSMVAERIFGEKEAVVEAVRSHTTGKVNMSLLEKIIYIADYIEPNRDFPGVDTLRSLAFTDLDEALKMGLNMTIDMLQSRNQEVSPESLEALAYLEHR